MSRNLVRTAALAWLLVLLLALAVLVFAPIPTHIIGSILIGVALVGAFALHLLLLARSAPTADDDPPSIEPAAVLEAELRRKDRGSVSEPPQRNA